MLKELVVKVKLGDEEVTIELGFKGDGVQTVHAYTADEMELPHSCSYDLFMKNEEGEKNHMSGQFMYKEDYLKFLMEGYGIQHWDMQHFYNVDNYFAPGTPGHKKYDMDKQFLLEGISPAGVKNIITTEEADGIAQYHVEKLTGRNYVEDYELSHLGHVYGLSNGDTFVVRGDGSWYWNIEDDLEVEDDEDDDTPEWIDSHDALLGMSPVERGMAEGKIEEVEHDLEEDKPWDDKE